MVSQGRFFAQILLCFAFCFLTCAVILAQQNSASSAVAPIRLTLEDALQRARQNSVEYQATVTEAKIAHEDKKQAVATLLPGVNYNTSMIYTQGNGPGNNVRFIANNAVHEYISWGNVHEA